MSYDPQAPLESSLQTGEPLPPWGIHRAAWPDAGWHEMHRRRRAKTPPIAKYVDTLCLYSQRLRQRSVPPPPPPPYHEPSWPRRPFRPGPGQPPQPPWEGKREKPNSDFYRHYAKSIYEREPLFDPYIRSLPGDRLNLYNYDNIQDIKKDFHDMIGDKWTRKGFQDPSVEHNLAAKLMPWREYVARGGETASDRLRREHASRGYYCPIRVPKIRVYHRSTWEGDQEKEK